MMENKKNNLNIQVKNFGPIRKADIDLRPLTVFVGPSNTGKTYLAVLLYALHQYFGVGRHSLSAPISPARRRLLRRNYLSHPIPRNKELTDTQKSALRQVMRGIKDPRKKNGMAVPKDLFNSTADNHPILRNGICRCFGLDNLSTLFRYGDKRKDTRIVLNKKIQGSSKQYKCAMKLHRDKIGVASSISGDLLLPIKDEMSKFITDYKMQKSSSKLDSDFFAEYFIDTLNGALIPEIASPLHLRAYYLPANRTGIMHAHKVLVSSLIEQATVAGPRPTKGIPPMAGVLADFMEQLLEIDKRRITKSNMVWQDIEDNILKGNVDIDQSLEYPDFTYKPGKWLRQTDRLPLNNASSMVSELAPVVLYLKHVVDRKDILIVDQPESLLHPEMQVEFTRRLAVLVKNGIRVLVTTHSEWMIEELANIVNRSKIEDESNEVYLSDDDVGVWSFNQAKRQTGSTIEEIELDSGTYTTGYEEITESLHNEWARITGLIGNR